MPGKTRLNTYGKRLHFLLKSSNFFPARHNQAKILVCPQKQKIVSAHLDLILKATINNKEFQTKATCIHKREVFLDAPFSLFGQEYFVKIYSYSDFSRILENVFYFSDAYRNFNTLCFLMEQGVQTTPPLALINVYQCGLLRRSYLVIERLPKLALDYKMYLDRVDKMSSSDRGSFFRTLGHAIGRLHHLNVFTRDTDKNTMVMEKDGEYSFHFFDFDSVHPWKPCSFSPSMRTLKRFLVPQHLYFRQDVLALVKAYTSERNIPKWNHRLMQGLVDELSKDRHRYPPTDLFAG